MPGGIRLQALTRQKAGAAFIDTRIDIDRVRGDWCLGRRVRLVSDFLPAWLG